MKFYGSVTVPVSVTLHGVFSSSLVFFVGLLRCWILSFTIKLLCAARRYGFVAVQILQK